jgi:RNA polymerase sigma-70 factor (sigma-E family)
VDSDSEQRFTTWAAARVATLHRTAFLLCGDWQIAEDLVQESLARAALHWRRIERVSEPDAYVRRILINQARQRFRRRSAYEWPAERLPESGIGDGAEARARRDALMTALSALPARQRAAVVLRYFEQLSEAETADALGCSVGTVKSQTSRALVTLRRALITQELPC